MKTATWLRALAIAAVLLGVFFRMYHLDRKTFWEDELFGTVHMMGHTEGEIVARSAELTNAGLIQAYFRVPERGAGASDSLGTTVAALATEDVQHPPLYYVLGRLWSGVFGTSAAALRALSVLAAILAIPAAFWLACELFDRRDTAWIATSIVALAPFHVLYAQEAREYAMWTVMLLVLCAAFLRACRLGTTAAWALYGASLVTGLYLFPLTLLVAGGCGAFLLARVATRTRRMLAAYAISTGIAIALFAPWLRLIVGDLIHTGGVPRGMAKLMTSHLSVATIALNFLRNVRGVFVDLGRFTIRGHASTGINLGLTVVITGLVAYALYRLARGPERRAFAFVACALVLPAVPLIAHDMIVGGKLVDQSRYFIPTYLGLELAVAALFAEMIVARGAIRLVWTTAFVVVLGVEALSCGISSQAKTWWNKDYEVSQDVAAVVNQSPNPLVVSDFTTARALGLGYYLKPSVALHVRLHCDMCLNETPDPTANLLADSKRYGRIFLLGDLDGADERGRLRDDPRIQLIDVAIYSNTPKPLGMFLSI